jgi:hypothetical protein
MQHWTKKYLSIPYSEMNCAEFTEYVLKDKFDLNFKFPQSQGSFFMESHQIKQEMFKFVCPVPTDEPKDGDLVLMSGRRLLSHVGLYVNIKDQDYVLHTQKTFGCACLHKLKEISFYGLFFEGFYKWQK